MIMIGLSIVPLDATMLERITSIGHGKAIDSNALGCAIFDLCVYMCDHDDNRPVGGVQTHDERD